MREVHYMNTSRTKFQLVACISARDLRCPKWRCPPSPQPGQTQIKICIDIFRLSQQKIQIKASRTRSIRKGTRALPVPRQLCIGDILIVLKITKPQATSIYSFLSSPIKELNVVCKRTEAFQQNNINNNVRLFDIYLCKICPTIVLLTDRTVHNAALKTLERKIALCRGFDINAEAKFGSVTCPNSLGRECLKNITYSW